MIYSKLYKNYYPFHTQEDILVLNQEEREILVDYITGYPPRAVEAIRRAWKCGFAVEGYERSQGWLSMILPSRGVGAILVDLRNRSRELISKINSEEPFTDNDIEAVNHILYSNRYCRLLSFFVLPAI